jgi:hypothetical protein
VFFSSNTNGYFQADGSFYDGTDTSALVANGSVFTMGGNDGSARAITLTGATGRTKVYWLQKGVWAERQ